MSVCDIHLSNVAGDLSANQRGFGERITTAQKLAASEWSAQIEAFLPHADDLSGLPDGSWLLQIEFRLARPFTSKAEGVAEWFEIQNPIGRDHLTGLPIVRPTTWKGNLLFAARVEGNEYSAVRDRLFGITRDNETGQAGRLHFFPTFFLGGIGKEVVTPLARDTRTPVPRRSPIFFEVIPARQDGRFNLLYVPRPKGAGWYPRQIAEDLISATGDVSAMLLKYGFSAKKTSGWGIVEDALVSGVLTTKGSLWPAAGIAGARFVEPEKDFLKFLDEDGLPKADLKKQSGEWLSNQEYKNSGLGIGTLTEYKRFRAWYEIHGIAWVHNLAAQARQASVLRGHDFSKVSELPKLANKLAKGLTEAIGD